MHIPNLNEMHVNACEDMRKFIGMFPTHGSDQKPLAPPMNRLYQNNFPPL